MAEEQLIEIEGRVTQVLPGTMFRVELPNKHVVLGRISGKLRKNFIRIIAGDIVKLEMSPSDITQARIIYRLRSHESTAFRTTPSAAAPRPAGGHRGGARRRR